MERVCIAGLASVLLLASCDSSLLDEDVYSAFDPANFFQAEQDAVALVNAAYASEQDWSGRNDVLLAEVPTDLFFVRGGSLERAAQPLEDYTWDATHTYLGGAWSDRYNAIHATNLALDRIPEIDFDAERRSLLLGEARFIRAEAYTDLYDKFGPVPLITSSEVDPDARPSRATEADLYEFVANELRTAAAELPLVAAQYGRATTGAALSLLARWELNHKAWQEAADVAKEVMDLGVYALFDAPLRSDLFDVENERNSEFIHVRPYVTGINGNTFSFHVTPMNYQFKNPPKVNYTTDWRMYSAFIDTFDPADQRLQAFIFEYVDTNGNTIVLGNDNARSFKYQEDMQATSTGDGGDIPVIRYADILLIRAEALNELEGPNAESIALINQVREKAGLPGIDLASFPSTEALRDHILAERGWEFHTELLRRQDLIRHGKLIEYAQNRGALARPHHVRYPIPQSEIDKNTNLEQNEGY